VATNQHNTDSANFVPTRRDILTRAVPAALGAAVLPVAALATTGSIALPDVDPHLGWWRERNELKARADEITRQMDEEGKASWLALEKIRAPIWHEQWEADRLICDTPPTSPVGALVIAATVVAIQTHLGPVEGEPSSDWEAGGVELARYTLDHAPADLRAMVEGGVA
jgi:hypothetical protein